MLLEVLAALGIEFKDLEWLRYIPGETKKWISPASECKGGEKITLKFYK